MTLDIDTWLNGIGLGQYAAMFRSNEIDASLLRGLNGDDLKEMGITALGHRKKLLEAIAALSSAPDASSTTAITAASGATPVSGSTAERRQLTVMFCDLVGSTALSGRLDPEDLQQLIRSYHDAVAAAVAPYAGHIAQFLGDGVLVYFGYPLAHEDDAARAVHAGLDIIKALGCTREGLGIAEQRQHSNSRVWALYYTGEMSELKGDWTDSIKRFTQALELAERYGLKALGARAKCGLGRALVATG